MLHSILAVNHTGDTDMVCGLIQPIFRLGKPQIWPPGLQCDAMQIQIYSVMLVNNTDHN